MKRLLFIIIIIMVVSFFSYASEKLCEKSNSYSIIDSIPMVLDKEGILYTLNSGIDSFWLVTDCCAYDFQFKLGSRTSGYLRVTVFMIDETGDPVINFRDSKLYYMSTKLCTDKKI